MTESVSGPGYSARDRRIPPQALPDPNTRPRRGFVVQIGSRLTLGIRRTRRSPFHYFVGPSGLGAVRRGHWYPLTADGWASAWASFAEGDPSAADVYQRRLVAHRSKEIAKLEHEAKQNALRESERLERERKQLQEAETAARRRWEEVEVARRVHTLRAAAVFASMAKCSLQGGYHIEPLHANASTDLYFTDDRLLVTDQGSPDIVLAIAYEDLIALRIEGPGAITTGGGFVGGGFGLKGATEGMLIASALNAVTTRTTIQTIIEVQDRERDLIWLCGTVTPERLRILLMPVYARIRQTTQLASKDRKSDQLDSLKKLAALHDTGVIGDREFEQAKQRIIGSL
jgi:hypothetical protein